MGCSYPEAQQGHNVARIIGFLAGFGDTLPGVTINRFCGSSMSAVHHAAGQNALGATGARLVGKAASVLKREGGRFALATQCVGEGQGIATILEAV
jgi:acetyl-CoA acyltransferase